MKAIFTVGVSGSGKSTWARDQRGYRVIDRDVIRRRVLKSKEPDYDKHRENMWDSWNWDWETEVSTLEHNQLMHHIMLNENVIICETNLGVKQDDNHLDKMKLALEEAKYEISYNYNKVELDEAIRRDRKRLDSVGDYVIYMQWLKWLQLPAVLTGIRKYVKDELKPKCIVSDIDGTVAKNMGRPPFEWSRVGEDLPILEIANLVKVYSTLGFKVIFLTGRSEECRQITTDWLKQHVVDEFDMFMRPEGDYSKDRDLKQKMFFENIEPNYNVEFVIDDRKQVVNLWTDINVKLLNVGNIYETF